MNKNKGRPLGSKKEITVLLNHHGWILEIDQNFPSNNYMVKKSGKNHVAYCCGLESALKTIFDVSLVETVKCIPKYCARLEDLHDAIIQTKNEFAQLLSISPILKNYNKPVEKKTSIGEGSSPLIQPKPLPDIPNPFPDEDDEEERYAKGTERI